MMIAVDLIGVSSGLQNLANSAVIEGLGWVEEDKDLRHVRSEHLECDIARDTTTGSLSTKAPTLSITNSATITRCVRSVVRSLLGKRPLLALLPVPHNLSLKSCQSVSPCAMSFLEKFLALDVREHGCNIPDEIHRIDNIYNILFFIVVSSLTHVKQRSDDTLQ